MDKSTKPTQKTKLTVLPMSPMRKTSQTEKKTLPPMRKTSLLPPMRKTSQTEKKIDLEKKIKEQNSPKEVRKNRMENLPKDVKEIITKDLTPWEFVQFCTSETDKTFCSKNDVWVRRMKKDFDFLVPYFSDLSYNAKNRYLEIFHKISKNSERLSKAVLDTYGDFQVNFRDEFKYSLYINFYNYSINSLKNILEKNEKDEENIKRSTVFFGLGPLNLFIPPLLRDKSFSKYWLELINEIMIPFNIDMIKYLGLFQKPKPVSSDDILPLPKVYY
jgi:hypothetical protein